MAITNVTRFTVSHIKEAGLYLLFWITITYGQPVKLHHIYNLLIYFCNELLLTSLQTGMF